MPRRSQCVFGCDKFDILHRFPKPSSLERFLQWKDIVGQILEGKTNDDIYTNYRICNNHFEDRYFYPRSKQLAKTAYPSLKLGLMASMNRPDIPQSATNNDIPLTPITLPGASTSYIPNPNQILKPKTGTVIKKKLSKRSQQMLKKIDILKNKLKEKNDHIKAAQKMSKTKLFHKVLKSLPVSTQLFIKMQLTQHNKKNRGKRFNIEDKLLALSLYKKSPKAYFFLRKLFILPSKQTLQNVLKLISLKPGINQVIFQQLATAAKNLNTEQRLCVLMFDEMAISPSINFDISSDQIVGFENFGENESENIADHVLVFMIKGIKANFKQPVYYGFCKSATKAAILKNIVKTIIVELFQAGLIVVATVCDQSTTNCKVVEELIMDTKREYLRKETEFRFQAFEINNKKIFPLFDAPHLLKCIRNNLLTKELRFTQEEKVKIAKWEHLKLLLDLDDGEDDLRMCNKLTEAHILPEKIPKMKVKHAAQVFSQRVSGALRFCARKNLLPEECLNTADLLLLFDQLFDSFNGGSYKTTAKVYKNCVKPTSEHFKLWKRALPILRSMGFRTQSKKRDGSLSISYVKVPSIKNWIHNILTVQDLWRYLSKEYNVTSLLMRNLNQDPVENFFSSVRSHGARNTNPTCHQFQSIYKTLLVNNLSSNHSLGANCEEDGTKILHNLDILLAKSSPQPQGNEEQIEGDSECDILAGSDSHEDSELVTQTKKYVAGYVIRKTKLNVIKSCNICNYELCDTTPPQEDSYILSIDITKRSLQHPSQNFITCVKNIIKIIKYQLKKDPHKCGISIKVYKLIENIVKFDFLSCINHKENVKKYVSRLLLKLITYSWCNNVNRILKGRHMIHQGDKIKKQAFEYFKTHRKNKNK